MREEELEAITKATDILKDRSNQQSSCNTCNTKRHVLGLGYLLHARRPWLPRLTL